jgi:hypothetical protein
MSLHINILHGSTRISKAVIRGFNTSLKIEEFNIVNYKKQV